MKYGKNEPSVTSRKGGEFNGGVDVIKINDENF